MNGKETQKASGFPVSIIKSQQRHIFILIKLVSSSLSCRIGQISRWGSIDIRVQDCRVPEAQFSRGKIRVRFLNGTDSSCHDGIGSLFDITQGSQLGKEIFEVPSYTRMLMGPDERDVFVGVDAWELGGELGHDRAPYPGITHGYVCIE